MGKGVDKETLDNMSIEDRIKYLNDLKIMKEHITKIQTDAIVNASKSDSDDDDDDSSDGEELQHRGYYIEGDDEIDGYNRYSDEWVDEDED